MIKYIRQSFCLFIILLIAGIITHSNAQTSNYNFCSSGFASSEWTCLGQNPTPDDHQTIGIVMSVAVHPSNPNIIYAGGGRWGGLRKTTNGGSSWTNKTDIMGVAALGIGCRFLQFILWSFMVLK